MISIVQNIKGAQISIRNIFFELWYRFGKPVWVIDEPQPELMAVVAEGVIRGPLVLDVGCGAGDNAVYIAQRGFSVTGIDVSAAAIATAERKARKLDVTVRFIELNAFKLGTLARKFDTVIDYGLFHHFDGESRVRYVRALRGACASQGQLLLQCFSDQGGRARRFAPRHVSQDEIRASFAEGWQIEWIRPASFKTNKRKEYPAWLTLITCVDSD